MDFSGEAVYISARGIGIVTDFPLEPGFVRFLGGVELKAGLVVWSRKLGNRYRAGIWFFPLYPAGSTYRVWPQQK